MDDLAARHPLRDDDYERILAAPAVQEAMGEYAEVSPSSHASAIAVVRAVACVLFQIPDLPRDTPERIALPERTDDDVVMSFVEWNGRLAETIVAQADQIVALNVELRAARAP